MPNKNIKPSLTKIRKILKDAQFDPRKDATWHLVADVGNCDYYEEQAIILIKEAQNMRRSLPPQQSPTAYKNLIRQAIQILTLSELYGPQEI